jgi:hypothetical protein
MINERRRPIWRRMLNGVALFAAHHPDPRQRDKTMTSAMTAFGIAVGGTSLLYLLMTRLQNGKRKRGWSSASSGSDSGHGTGGGWTISNWFGGGDSASDNSCSSSDGGDSGGGGDCGGGGGD